VNPEDLDEETRNYFLYVLKQQQEEATHRLAAMRQQEDLGEQYQAFEGLSDADLDDETRAYREYLEQSMANIAKYLSEDIGVGVRNVMVMMSMDENERKGEGIEPVEEREAMDDEEEGEGGGGAAPSNDKKPEESINGTKAADNNNGNGNDGEGYEGNYEEPDSPLPDNWTRELFTTGPATMPAAGAPAVPDLDNNHADADADAAAAAADVSAVEGAAAAAAEVDEEQSEAASMHDID
jgi:hypothetical protein